MTLRFIKRSSRRPLCSQWLFSLEKHLSCNRDEDTFAVVEVGKGQKADLGEAGQEHDPEDFAIAADEGEENI